VFNDVHVPFHNKNGVAAVLEFCRDNQPDTIVINGDFLDCYSISSFHKEPGAPTLQEELDEGLEILDQLRRYCPLADIWYTEGNHEERLRRLIKQQHGLYGLRAFELESLLEFDRLGIKYKQYGDIVWLGDLALYHGTHISGHAGYSAKRELERGGFKYIITGHVHRLAFHHRKGYTGNRWAIENGGLFDIEQCDYMLNPNWMNGFCMVYRDDENEVMQPNLIPVNYDGSFIWNNKWYGV
jgi:predicted phosphodiesterase